MKKRITALLLCLVMALSLIPTSAWAAESGISTQALVSNETQKVRYKILYISDEYNLGYNYGKEEYREYTCQYSEGHSGYNHSIAEKDIKAAAAELSVKWGETFSGWGKGNGNQNTKVNPFKDSGTTATQTTYTIWLVVKKSVPAPTDTDIKNIQNAVFVDCTTDNGHDNYTTIKGTLGSDYTVSGSGKNRTVTINNVSAYYPAGHSKDTDQTDKVTVELVYKNDAWTLADNGAAHLYVKCEQTPAEPEKPSGGDLEKITNAVIVDCTVDNTHDTPSAVKGTAGTDYTISEVKNNACTITINNVSAYYPAGHSKDTDQTDKVTVELVYVKDAWTLADNGAAHLYVKCEQTPAEPEKPSGSDLEKITNAVIVDCTADDTHDITSAVKGTAGTDYTISEVKNNACTITINNVSAYYPAGHSKDTDQTDKVIVELVYVKDAWTLAANGAAHLYVKCEQTPTKPTDLTAVRGVRVNCDASKQAPVTHSGMDFRFLAGTYTVSDVARDTNNAWYVTVTVTDPGKYVSSYDGMLGIMTGAAFVHDMYPANQQPTVKLVYDEQSESWNAVDAGTETVQYATINVICRPALPTIPELNQLGVNVKVSCATKDSKHTGKTYDALKDTDVVTGTITMNSQGQYECVLKLRDDTAKAYVTDYSGTTNADKKTHTLKDNGSVTLVWGNNGWELKDQSAKTLIITATCTTSTVPGGNIGPAKNPYTKDEPKKVESGKTFDAGIALYVGLGILSLTGSAVAIRKREEY